jgi:protein-L-isoaspartate(D-aspartate) O-methyltransferase
VAGAPEPGVTSKKRAPPTFPLPLERLAPLPRRLVIAPGDAAATVLPRSPAPRASRPVLRPQRPLQHAAESAARRDAPTGLGLDSHGVRLRMVERLRRDGLRHEAVLAALASVPRHCFVDSALATQAYEDTSLPLGHGQTISKPSVVARMLELLFEGSNARASGSLGRVLEIGTGCGYQAALLAQLSRQVLSVERIKPLHERARTHLASLREHRIRLVYGDGRRGHAPNAPYDSIIAAAGGDELPPAWFEQLAEGGRLVAPRLDAKSGAQSLVVVDRTAAGFVQTLCETVLFVPLKFGLD